MKGTLNWRNEEIYIDSSYEGMIMGKLSEMRMEWKKRGFAKNF